MARYTNMGKKRFLQATPYEYKPVELPKGASGDGRPKFSEYQKKKRSEHRRVRRQVKRQTDKFCFGCRKQGHILQDCPESGNSKAICFRCGSTEHTLSSCAKKGPLEFATCFICKAKGHLASKCPDNPKGLYPRGGGCKLCSSVHHFAKDCDKITREDVIRGRVASSVGAIGPDEDGFHEYSRIVSATAQKKAAKAPAKKVVSF
ncbi:zf-CCHC type zinc finger protein [Schizosaccharomyces japonicus yFS275]|uniref:Zf-CCHC type zinc finger protein n=1 Tax=Schizosaccharomyces japonicus (strain yFS275 / FY16936) TaxID=402676 RepID=B6JY39_SCHJY|nr:zf-CCHC type zinc finger protein [Schizosaccharomyces japonicus yFS275]EEB06457.2 zf-CCHC type zinc finger protein [Schizosaccharomyces japonicus yFS275]